MSSKKGKGGESPSTPKKSKAKVRVPRKTKNTDKPKLNAQATPKKKPEKPQPRATQPDDLREFVCMNERGVCFTDNMANKIYPGHIGLLTEQQGENLIRANIGVWRE